ncbi:GerMN domain-containing protein [Cellulosilyticum sp. I15G10I2]|uniref:GerMN domain-containing protein n=1 Tax=Cellulosilyticum sp. I15G10I2 TaxID=1892843 RepID=UPI00085C0EE5|nr:GerMN domain-containing protein [Cellulosilyticum sp. I15G10I2]
MKKLLFKKFLSIVLISVMCGSILSGCGKKAENLPKDNIPVEETEDNNQEESGDNNQITDRIKVFYGDEGNEKMVSETREITYRNDEEKYKAALEELFKGAVNEKFISNINSNTEVLGTFIQGDDLTVDLSKAFNTFDGSVAEIIAVGSLVNTMTQFKDVERVKILIEGQEFIGPSGESRGFMEPFVLDPQSEIDKEVMLYFGDANAAFVVGEKRVIRMKANDTEEMLLKKVTEELIKGSQNETLNPTIPPSVKVLSVSIENNIAHVDFSDEMHTHHWGGAAGESMTINSIVNTLTEFNAIKQVKITVENEPLAIEHTVLKEPVGRNEDMIQR